MKILITGAYGQLGNEIKKLAENFANLEFLYTDADSLDITNENAVESYFKKNKPDFLINCAAYTAVDKAESETETAYKINALAPGLLAKYSRVNGARIIHISTDYVFDGHAYLPYSEDSKVEPQSIYGETKLKGEQFCQQENQDSIIIRTSWLYSEYGNNFVKTMIRLGREKTSLNVVFDQVGTPTYAADLAVAILEIITLAQKNPEKFIPGIYHYSNEGVASWYDFAKSVFEISGINCLVNPVLSDQFPTAAKRPNYSVLNKSKIKNIFGISIPYWKDSLRICVQKLA